MTEQVTNELNRELLSSILRTNFCFHLGKPLTTELIDEMILKITESIEYFLNREDKKN